jgi:hypothetical protein
MIGAGGVPADWDALNAHVDARARKERLCELLVRLADQWSDHTPKDWADREWFSAEEILAHLVRETGEPKPDLIERLREAIYHGYFDRRRRSTIACLHPMSLGRFDRASACFSDLFEEHAVLHLWLRRADAFRWFAHEKVEPPAEWCVSAEPTYRLSADKPGSRALDNAYEILLRRWGPEGPPRRMTIKAITEDANKHRGLNKADLSDATVRRILGLEKSTG